MPKKTFEQVKKSGNDAVIQLKENQKFLQKNCEEMVLKQNYLGMKTITEKHRNRKEIRVVKNYLFTSILPRIPKEWERYIREFVKIERSIERFDTKTKKWIESYEESFYLSTKCFTVEEYGMIIRGHWAIENRNHYVKDVSMNEDASRIRKNADIFVKLRSFALNIMRANNIKNIKSELYENSLHLGKCLKKYRKFL